MTHVLFLTQVLPYPLDSGPRVRQYHMLRHLTQHHQLTLVSFVRPDDTPAAVRHLQAICDQVHTVPMRRSLWRNVRAGVKGTLTGLPLVIVRDEIRQMMDTLDRVTRQNRFDVIHADQLSMALYGRRAAGNGSRSPRLLDEHNAVHVLAQQMAAQETNPVRRAIMAREARALARYEAAMCREYDAILTVTQEDQDHLLELFPARQRKTVANKFTVVPICVDPEQVKPIGRQPRPPGPPTILHLGTMFWPPNVAGVLWFARQVLPSIHRERPDARLVVVGKAPPPEIEALAADPRIQIAGYVDDPAPYIASADVFIVPLQIGEGMRVKILDAWLWGLPVVSTPIGAEGIRTRDGENILIAANAEKFATAVMRVLTDNTLSERLRVAGRAWVEANYAWQAVYQRVDQVYAKLLDDSKRLGELNRAGSIQAN